MWRRPTTPSPFFARCSTSSKKSACGSPDEPPPRSSPFARTDLDAHDGHPDHGLHGVHRPRPRRASLGDGGTLFRRSGPGVLFEGVAASVRGALPDVAHG